MQLPAFAVIPPSRESARIFVRKFHAGVPGGVTVFLAAVLIWADPVEKPHASQPDSYGRTRGRNEIPRSRFRKVKQVAQRVFRKRSDVKGDAPKMRSPEAAKIIPESEFPKISINSDKFTGFFDKYLKRSILISRNISNLLQSIPKVIL